MTLPRLSLCTALVLAALSTLNAQSVATTPVGAMTYSFPATTSTTSTYISVPLTNQAVYTGPIVSITSSTITFNNPGFTPAQFAQAGSPFFARVASGNQAGRMMLVTANTADTITVDTSDNSSQTTPLSATGWSLAAGDRVEIVVGDTLASLFGNNTVDQPLIFTGSTSAFTADTISIYNKALGKFDAYYFSTSSGYWRSSSVNTNANNLTIYPEAAIGITRRSGRSAINFSVVGVVPATSPLTKVTGGTTAVYTSTRFPTPLSLSQLNLSNWTKSNSAFTADTLQVYNSSTGKFDTYYQRLDNTWRRSDNSAADQSNFSIDPTAAVVLVKRGTVANATSFVVSPIPYSL